MKIDNDKYYYQIGNGNEFIEISEKIAHEVMLMDKMEKANERRMRYHGAIYSLDRDDGIVGYRNLENHDLSLEERVILKEMTRILSICIKQLPKIQKRRIILHFYKGMGIMEIARSEKVSWTAVDLSIKRAVKNIRKCFMKLYEGKNSYKDLEN